MTRTETKPALAVIFFLYACAALQFVRFYTKTTTFYLHLPAYLSGHERIPFQERVLPIFFLRFFSHSALFDRFIAHSSSLFSPEKAPFFLLSLLSLLIAALYLQALYNSLTGTGSLGLFVFPLFLFAVMWSYSIHLEANYSYPYDLPSLAFFTAGLYYIYNRKFLGLLFVILIGTFNRETTLFLIGIYAIDGASTEHVAKAFQLSRIPWARTLLLTAIWCAIKLSLRHHFAGNDTSENFNRIANNLSSLRPRLLPALLNMCGYCIPVAVLLQGSIRPRRFAHYLLIVVPWIAVMFYTGVLIETRVYGELCSLAAVALVLIMEHRAHSRLG